MSRKGKRYFRIGVGLILVLVLLMIISILTLTTIIYYPIPFQKPKFDEVEHWVSLHRSSSSPMIRLPEKYRRYSATGAAYVTGNYIFIPAWIGRRTVMPNFMSDDQQCQGYLFTNGKLTYDPNSEDIPQIMIYVPNFSGLYHFNSPHGTVQVPMMVDSQINSHWYEMDTMPATALE